MVIKLAKYKYANGIFYKPLENGVLKFISDNKFTLYTIPNIGFNGKYEIISLYKKESDRTIFNITQIESDEFFDIDFSNSRKNEQIMSFKTFFSLSNDKRKIMIFDQNVRGGIFKS